ncbi:DUF3080 family protein [Vibrio maerlii]|uniref:DUF3080 family protein n=1 Tax=Vibrio maerlii TaxID=2231648 RepID=UPI000E3DBBC5|nr:DUF3080 family protein [Vibrio maerlii]
MKKWVARGISLAIGLMTSGCLWQDEHEAMFNDYQDRISNVLGVENSTAPDIQLITIPSKRKVHHEIPPVTLGLLESYQLRRCGLFQLIAEKNSQLGKVQDQFHHLDYETRLLNTLERCLVDETFSLKERQELESVQKTKQSHYPLHVRNLLVSSKAMSAQLSGSAWLSNSSATSSVMHAIDSIALLTSSSLSWQEKSTLNVKQYQEVLEKSKVIGDLYYSKQRAVQWLDLTTETIRNNSKLVPCGKNRDTTKLKYLNNVFQLYYVEQVQPYLAYLNKTHHELKDASTLINTLFIELNESYPNDTIHQQFKQASKRHVKAWQTLFKRCDVSPAALKS